MLTSVALNVIENPPFRDLELLTSFALNGKSCQLLFRGPGVAGQRCPLSTVALNEDPVNLSLFLKTYLQAATESIVQFTISLFMLSDVTAMTR